MDPKTPIDSIETENKETIEQILRFHECDESIMVKMIIVMEGASEGDNYMSIVKRLIISGTHNKNQNQNGMQTKNVDKLKLNRLRTFMSPFIVILTIVIIYMPPFFFLQMKRNTFGMDLLSLSSFSIDFVVPAEQKIT